MALTLSMLVRPRAAVVALRLVRRRGGARLVLASSSSSSTPSSTSSTRATPANGAEVPRRAVALSVPEDFVVPEWWDSATPSETARALELLPRLVSFVGELDKDRLARVQTLEAQLEGMDAGAKSVAAHLRLDVAQLWELRVKSLDDSLKVLQADKRETAEAYRARVSTLEATLASARDEPKALLAAMEAAQQEGRLGRGALETALASLRAENVYSKDQLEKERELHRAALEQARSATFLHAPKLGAIGEGDMEDVIVDALRCDISDVSKTAGMGDRFVTTPDGMKMFQETKAKDRLNSKLDIDRFKADVQRALDEGRINAALFVSLKTKTLPNAGPYHVEWLSPTRRAEGGGDVSIPVVYVSSGDAAVLGLAVRATHWLATHALAGRAAAAKSEDDTDSETFKVLAEERRVLSEALPEIFSRFELMAADSDERLKMLRKLLEHAEGERRQNFNLQALVDELSTKVAFVTSPGALSQLHCKDAERLVRDRMQGSKAPKLADFSTPEKLVIQKAGGIRAVLDALNGTAAPP